MATPIMLTDEEVAAILHANHRCVRGLLDSSYAQDQRDYQQFSENFFLGSLRAIQRIDYFTDTDPGDPWSAANPLHPKAIY
jgi:hypothetical protein